MSVITGKELRGMRNTKGLTLQSVADKLGVTRNSVSKWESDFSYPSRNNLERLLNLYKIDDNIHSNCTELERLTGYRKIPVINMTQAGNWAVVSDNEVIDYINTTYEGVNLYALEVKGDSMYCAGDSKSLCEGEFILCDQDLPPQTGDVVVATIDDNPMSTTVKKYYNDGLQVILKPLNKAYPDITITKDSHTNFHIKGVVVEVVRKFKR